MNGRTFSQSHSKRVKSHHPHLLMKLWSCLVGYLPLVWLSLGCRVLRLQEHSLANAKARSRGLTFTWWGCCGLCLWHRLPASIWLAGCQNYYSTIHTHTLGFIRIFLYLFLILSYLYLCLWHKPTELAHSVLFCSWVCFCLDGPFNCISFHKFSRQLSAFSLCSSDLSYALLVLSTVCLVVKVSLSPV